MWVQYSAILNRVFDLLTQMSKLGKYNFRIDYFCKEQTLMRKYEEAVFWQDEVEWDYIGSSRNVYYSGMTEHQKTKPKTKQKMN